MDAVQSSLLRIADPAAGPRFQGEANTRLGSTHLRRFFQGTVLDASHEGGQWEFRLRSANHRCESVLVPMALDLATAGGAALDWIRNASDAAVHASKADAKEFERVKRRQEALRMTMSDIVKKREFAERVRTPEGRRIQAEAQAPILH